MFEGQVSMVSKSGSGDVCVVYVFGNQTLLDDVKGLWEALNQHHLKNSTHFKQYYEAMTFEKRKQAILKKATAGEMHVAVAVDSKTNQKVGYCVSSLDGEKTGEIESIFVASAYRGKGVGDTLMKDALAWMDGKSAGKKTVAVGAGNEQAFGFYERYGFVPRKTVLEQARSK